MTEYVAEWQVDGPAFQSVEDTRFGNGRLGIDYTDNCDTRFNCLCLGPLINTVNLGAAGGTGTNAIGAALSNGMNATKYIYVIRGTKWAKVQASDMTLLSDDSETALSEAATCILYVKSASAEEIAIGMAGTAYQVITTVSTGATDTDSANDDSVLRRIMDYGFPSNAILGANGATIYHNVVTGTVDMDDPTWVERTVITGPSITVNSFALDGTSVVIGTNEGLVYFDNEFEEFRIAFPEIAADDDNCKQMKTWTPMGVIVPLSDGIRVWKNGQTWPIGPETYPSNESPVQGRCTAVQGTARWLYLVLKNPGTDEAYLCATRPPRPSDPFQGQPLAWYPIATLTNTDSEFLLDIGKYGGRTSPTMIGGHEDDMLWFTMGRIAHEIDDSAYRFASTGTAFLTELRRHPHHYVEPLWFELETSGCDANKTVQIAVSADGGDYENQGSAITTNGFQRVPPSFDIRGGRIKPKITLATNSSSASPKVTGRLRMGYRVVNRPVDGEYLEGER